MKENAEMQLPLPEKKQESLNIQENKEVGISEKEKAASVEMEADVVKKKLSEIRSAIKNEISSSSENSGGVGLKMEELKVGDLKVEIVGKNGEILEINDFVPKDVVIKKDKEFAYSDRKKEVYVTDEANSSKFLISLFHEIGHADYFAQGKNISLEPILRFYIDSGSFVVMLGKAAKVFLKKTLEKTKDGLPVGYALKNAIIETNGFMSNHDTDDFYPDWFKKYQDKLGAKSERYAWYYALKQLRKIKQSGFDVFGGFKDTKEIIAYIDDCLLSYEEFSQSTMTHKTQKYDPIFLKKIRKEFTDLETE